MAATRARWSTVGRSYIAMWQDDVTGKVVRLAEFRLEPVFLTLGRWRSAARAGPFPRQADH